MHNRIVFMVFGCGPFSGKMVRFGTEASNPFSGKMVIWAIIGNNGEVWFYGCLWALWVFGVRGNMCFAGHVFWLFLHACCLSHMCFYLVVFGLYLPAEPFLVP